MALTEVSIRRPVATAMVYLILIVLGIVAFRSLPIDLLPKIEFTQLTVRTDYPNVGPEEVEQIITDRIENAVAGLPNLERVTSRSEEGESRVRLEFARGTNIDEAANDLRAALDGLRDDLPLEASTPRVFKLDLDRVEVVSLAVTSTRPFEEVTRLLEDEMARRFEQIPGVGAIDLRGGVYREIRVELDRDRLRATGLTALDVQQALARENATLPTGTVKSGLNDLYVRSLGEYRSLEQIERTVVATSSGRPVRVSDVAEVRDGYEDVGYLVEMNGVPAISLGIQKQSGGNTVEVARAVRREAERINEERDDIHMTVVVDQSDFINQSIGNVQRSAIWGSLLAVLVLYFFLRNRSSTLIITVAIPISVIATFALLFFGGLTLNQMTFGGLALGVGLIVDNAIVVLESIVRKREEEDLSHRDSARVGAREVTGAIIASTLTTCVIFVPVVFARTTTGALFQALALVVVFSLLCSLLVALTLVPMLASRFLHLHREARKVSSHQRMLRRVEGWYVGRLRGAMRHRARVFLGAGVALALALACWPLIPVELAPQTDADEIDIELEMARGTNIAVSRAFTDELEERVRAVVPASEVRLSSTEIRGDSAAVELKLAPQQERSMRSSELADIVRREVDGRVPGGELDVQAQQGLWMLNRVFSSGGGGDALEIELRGWDLERADEIAAEMRRRMDGVPGIASTRVSRREGRPEERLEMDRERIAELGLSVREVGRTLLANVAGVEAGRYREGGYEFPLTVRLRRQDRFSADDLEGVTLRTPAGEVVALSSLVDRRRGLGPVEIERVDGQRVTYVTANLESGVALGDTMEAVRDALEGMPLPRGFSILYGGQYAEQLAARRDFSVAILMALALVYMLMAAQFERFVDPLIVMLAVPLALIGVVPTLLLTGTTLNLQSVMGLVMLIGIVVNNAIVLVDAINLLRRERKMGARDAVLEAARLRLRPILITTATTILGLSPLALGLGVGGEIQAALARVVIGGLVASTLVTLVLIPVTYDTVTAWSMRVRTARRGWGDEEDSRRATA